MSLKLGALFPATLRAASGSAVPRLYRNALRAGEIVCILLPLRLVAG